MCGIAGILGPNRTVVHHLAISLSANLAHRGPDDQGVEPVPTGVGDRSLTLVHRRLSILDLRPLGHQPMADPGPGNWTVYTGAVLNFHALLNALGATGL